MAKWMKTKVSATYLKHYQMVAAAFGAIAFSLYYEFSKSSEPSPMIPVESLEKYAQIQKEAGHSV